MGNTYAYAGAASAGLYHAGEGYSLCAFLSFFEMGSCRSRNGVKGEQFLCEALIHGQGGADIIRAGIPDSQQVKGRLHLAVFSVFSMQPQKDHISHLADRDDARAEKAFSAVFAQRFNAGNVGIALRDSSDVFRPVDILFKNILIVPFIS